MNKTFKIIYLLILISLGNSFFTTIKDKIGENPKEFFPILGEVILTVTTGNTPEEWNQSRNSSDAGKRNHLGTRGVGNAIVTVMAGSAIVKDLPEIADKLSEAVRKVKKVVKTLDDFVVKSLPEKLEDIKDIWKTKYPIEEMFEGRTLFEDMGHYRYKKTKGWAHTADIADNFKGVDFYKDYFELNNVITTKTAVSMKTTIITDVNVWLNSEPIKKNIGFLKDGLKPEGLANNGKIVKITNKAEIHIYMPKENITPELKSTWMNKLSTVDVNIKFEIKAIEDFVK